MIFDTENLINSDIRSSIFLLIASTSYRILISVNKDSFSPSVLIWMDCISFSCLITWGRNASTVWNMSSGGRHHCLISDLRSKPLYLFHHALCSLKVLNRCSFRLKKFPSTPSFWSVLSEMDVTFSKYCFCASWDNHSLSSLNYYFSCVFISIQSTTLSHFPFNFFFESWVI